LSGCFLLGEVEFLVLVLEESEETGDVVLGRGVGIWREMKRRTRESLAKVNEERRKRRVERGRGERTGREVHRVEDFG